MTAAVINQSVSTEVDATGCNIGVFYDHTGTGDAVSSGANIHGANYFGIVVDGDAGAVAINVSGANIHDIGEVPQNGTQHGNAIFYMNASGDTTKDDSRTCNESTNSVTGAISNNTVTAYQKNGITAKCTGVNVTISGNTVTGAGAVDYIAQNGIEASGISGGSIKSNTVSENEYTGLNDASSTGVLVFGTLDIGSNTLSDNDIGIALIGSNKSTLHV